MLGYQIAACEGSGTGEQGLLRGLLDRIAPGDVVLGLCPLGDVVDHRGRVSSRRRRGDGAARMLHH